MFSSYILCTNPPSSVYDLVLILNVWSWLHTLHKSSLFSTLPCPDFRVNTLKFRCLNLGCQIRVHNLHKSSLLTYVASDPDFKAQILPSCQIILPRFQVTYSEFLVSYQDFRVHTLPIFALLPISSCPDFRVKNFEIQMSDISSPILISGYTLCINLFSLLCYLALTSGCMILISGYIPWNQGFILWTNQLSLL